MDGREPLELIVTNFNRNFTGVSATAAAAISLQASRCNLNLVGHPLPGCPAPINLAKAISLTRKFSAQRPVIWHVRRNIEMLTAVIVRDVLGLPLRTVFTSSAQRLHSPFPRWLISRMDAVIATTGTAASFVPNVSAIVPHGVDTKKYAPAANRPECRARGGFPCAMGIAAIGRIRPEKGADIFVDAMIDTLPRLPGAKALVIGRTSGGHKPFENDLRGRVDRAGLSERILFTGELSAEKLARLLPGLSLLIAVPRYEGYGMTVLEAMACGVPVIASDTGNFAEFLDDGECGHLCETGDAAAVADLALRLLGNPGERERISAAGRKRAVEHFSIEGEVDAISRVYEALMENAGSRQVAGARTR